MEIAKDASILHFISDVLSIITISTCFILKIPQILSILKVKNANGINLVGLLMELTSYTIMFSYNFRNRYALLSYMEYPIILIQELILILFVMYYKSCLNVYSAVGAVVYGLAAAGLLLGTVPLGVIAFLVPLCTPIGASSKVVQLLEILRTKNSESVSVLTWFISAFTNFTRVFTISVDSADLTLLLNFGVNVVLSSSVMIAAYAYKHPKKD
ncbi:solute carrier family 66 member 3 [Tribolium castaneum]|uniref:Solute carrier family 66 member 3 n=1 Tax=Tribolium castaneum TaxID=7070 RepID=A0A139WL27_TRICA|nr:PREDICTED: PQ-loop repeat-containing protein 3 [Tribolium castaneum]KYB28642.1 PQ-loop repeat-containing protein 3-like Protein [Tribolium castaneum]|eukprot:XP_008190901.1 PREDICTED: PQ-loop repeat-containing protein 3 [Tribolium castaneum]